MPSSTTGSAAAAAAASMKKQQVRKNNGAVRKAAGQIWTDKSLDEWPKDDFRIFCGDMGNEVTDDLLANAFRKYPSFQKAKVVRDKKTGKTKGYGFVSFGAPEDMVQALREVNGRYVGNRPIRVWKSTWKDRNIDSNKNQKAMALKFVGDPKDKSLRKFRRVKKQDPEKQKEKQRNKMRAAMEED